MKKKFHPVIISLFILVTIALIFTTILAIASSSNREKVSKGVFVDKIDMSNCTQAEVKDKLNNHFTEKENQEKITLLYKDINQTKTLSELGVEFKVDDIVKDTLAENKLNNFIINGLKVFNPSPERKNITLDVAINENQINEFIADINKNINKNRKIATINFINNKIEYKKGDPIIKVDASVLIENIINMLKTSSNANELSLNIPTKDEPSTITPELFSKMTIISSFKTALPNANVARTNNIRLFMNKLNGSIVMPNDVFSSDKTAGRREISDGYRAAPAFASNKVVDSVAGGICQGVTTLYNAALYSDLEIVERTPHGLLVSYIEAGRDATIASGLIDFKFKNNKKNPIVLQTYVSNDGYVVSNVWGINENATREIKIVVEHPSALSSVTYKQTYENGKLIKSEHLSSDKYNNH